MRDKTYRDISCDIGPLYPLHKNTEPKYPMYSYKRAAYSLWQGVFNALIDQGRTEEEAFDVLMSKHMRWALDGKLAEALQQFGYEFAMQHGKGWTL